MIYVTTEYAVFSLTLGHDGFVAEKVVTLDGYENSLMGEAKLRDGYTFVGHTATLKIGEPMVVLGDSFSQLVTSKVEHISDVLPSWAPRPRIQVVPD